MEQKLGRLPAVIVTVLAAVGAYFLRRQQMLNYIDDTGRYVAHAAKAGITWLCVVMVLVYAAYCFLLRPRKKHTAIQGTSPLALLGTLAGALGLLMSAAVTVLERQSSAELVLAACSVVTALCWAVIALCRWRGKTLPTGAFMLPTLCYTVCVIIRFRGWSQDPMVLDYCYDLLALLSIMLASYHLTGFCFDRGHRRITAFFCFCGILFGAAAVSGGRMRELASTGGAMLWLASNLWLLLRPSRKRQEKAGQE